jgi:hypothetical protein
VGPQLPQSTGLWQFVVSWGKDDLLDPHQPSLSRMMPQAVPLVLHDGTAIEGEMKNFELASAI